MAMIELYATFALLLLIPVWGLFVVILIGFTLRYISRRILQFFRRQVPARSELPVEGHEISEPASTTPAFTRPQLRRRNCSTLGPYELFADPLQPTLEIDSDSTFCSEDYETAREYPETDSSLTSDSEGEAHSPKDAASATTMTETGAPKTFVVELQEGHQESAEGLRDAANCNGEDAESVKRRNIKMREEGVRIKVNYSQIASIKPAPAAAGGLRGGASRTTSPPSSSSPPPSSCPSTMSPASGLRSPAPTPEDPEDGIAPVLPASGPAVGQDILYRIDEKLLAIPADAVSRRLLRDGRYFLRHGKRQPRTVTSAEGSTGRQVAPSPVAAEGGLQGPSESEVWYPSELKE